MFDGGACGKNISKLFPEIETIWQIEIDVTMYPIRCDYTFDVTTDIPVMWCYACYDVILVP